jgi:hypothetical protein
MWRVRSVLYSPSCVVPCLSWPVDKLILRCAVSQNDACSSLVSERHSLVHYSKLYKAN